MTSDPKQPMNPSPSSNKSENILEAPVAGLRHQTDISLVSAGSPAIGASNLALETVFGSLQTTPNEKPRYGGFQYQPERRDLNVLNPFRTRTQMSFGHGVNKSFTASSPTADLVTWAANSIEYELLAGGDSAQKD